VTRLSLILTTGYFFRFFAMQNKTFMLATRGIAVTKAERSKLGDINMENLPFGKYFTDHMLEADYEGGEWKNVEIKPYQPLLLSPSLAALHYGQAIFEGVKAYKNSKGAPYIFRPRENHVRFNISAERMQMPAVPEEIFVEGMRQVVQLDNAWIPEKKDHSLYIRPLMFASDEMIGVRPSETYKFLILLSPTGPYYAAPMRLYVEEKYVRAAPGGIGFVKAAGNYGASMYATARAKSKGYDQVLWTDAAEHRWVQEAGTMNVVFIIGSKAITPDLKEGTILAGVTRDSVLTVLQELGLTVEERPISIDEVTEAYKAGQLHEAFGTGTAATIAPIRELCYRDTVMRFDTEGWKTAPAVKRMLDDIREGRQEDKWGWMVKA
jgi:branched-chain amino acid aminotransferase